MFSSFSLHALRYSWTGYADALPRGQPGSVCQPGRCGAGRRVAGWWGSRPRLHSLRLDSSVLSGKNPPRKGWLSVSTTLHHGRFLLSWGSAKGVPLTLSLSAPPVRAGLGGVGKGRDGKDRARRGFGRGRKGRICSRRVKLSLKHKASSPHALFFFLRSPPPCLQ